MQRAAEAGRSGLIPPQIASIAQAGSGNAHDDLPGLFSCNSAGEGRRRGARSLLLFLISVTPLMVCATNYSVPQSEIMSPAEWRGMIQDIVTRAGSRVRAAIWLGVHRNHLAYWIWKGNPPTGPMMRVVWLLWWSLHRTRPPTTREIETWGRESGEMIHPQEFRPQPKSALVLKKHGLQDAPGRVQSMGVVSVDGGKSGYSDGDGI